MSESRPLFEPTPLNVPRLNFEPFPPISNEAWLSRLMERITVRGVTAIHHRCTTLWRMAERRVGDDMLFYITQGRGKALIEGRECALTPGVAASFRRGTPHSATTDPRNPIHVISLHYTATVFGTLTLPELLRFPDSFLLADDKRVDAMFHEACREYALRPAGHERGLEALTLRILLHLIRHHGAFLENRPPELKLADLRRLLPAVEKIRGELREPAVIPDLARAAGLSEAQFRRVFHRTMGVSPVQYQRRVRMERACELLRHTDQKIEKIAEEVGYVEPAFFAHTFKRLIGVTPGRYRRTHEL